MRTGNHAAMSRPEEKKNARRPWKSDAQTAEKPGKVYHLLGSDFTGDEIWTGFMGVVMLLLALAIVFSSVTAYNRGYERGVHYAQTQMCEVGR